MTNFDSVTIFEGMSLADLFKKIHKNNKDIDKQIGGLIDSMVPIATSNAGSAVMLMPTVKDLIDVNVKNNEQLIKMAAIAQRAASSNASSNSDMLFDMGEIESLIQEQKLIQEQGNKLLEHNPVIQLESK
jgi:hypothetical protein